MTAHNYPHIPNQENSLGRHYNRFRAARVNESKGLRSKNAAKIAAINTSG